MKKFVKLVTLRTSIAIVLCASLLAVSPFRISSVAKPSAPAALKSESQFRSEAATYDRAIQAIGGIASMKLDTADDIKKALAILERERPNLKLQRSKLISIGISDATLAGAVKKRVTDKPSAEALVKELRASSRNVLKLDGAESVATRMTRKAEADAAILRRVAARLTEVGENIKKTRQLGLAPRFVAPGELRVLRTSFNQTELPGFAPESFAMNPQDPLTVALVVLAVYVVVIVVAVAAKEIVDPTTEEDRDRVSECVEASENNLQTCINNARREAFPVNMAIELLCHASHLLRVAECP